MQEKNNTTEIITVVAAVVAFLSGAGIINVDLDHVANITGQAKEIAANVDTSSVKSIVEGVYRIVCLIIGGSIITTYLKYKQKIVIQKQQTTEVKEPKVVIEKVEEVIEEGPVVDEIVEDPGKEEEYKLIKV